MIPMKRVIITGADGFVGSNTVEYFIQQGIEVLAIDIVDVPRRLKKHKLLTYISCDITNRKYMLEKILKDYYDTFVHFAWAGSAGPQRAEAKLQIHNAFTTLECMKMAKELGCKRFVCAGSIMEYEMEYAIHEQGCAPSTSYMYSLGKLTAHGLCKSMAREIDIELIWPIITNAYGVGELSPRFVNSTLRKIINNEPLQFTSAVQNYDFVYITDVARAFYLIAKNGKPFCEYIIGSGNAKPLKEFILEMVHGCGAFQEPIFGDIPFTGVNLPLNIYDTSKTKEDTGFEASISFSDGTKMTMDWLKCQK